MCSFNNFFYQAIRHFRIVYFDNQKKNVLRWLMIFLIYVTRNMFKFLYNVLFCLMILSIAIFWLSVFTLFKRTSCVNTTYVLFIVVVDEIISFINVKSRFIRVLISSKFASNFRSSLNKQRIDNTFFFFFFIVISFCMRFLINKCRINTFFISLLIFIISVFLLLNFVRIFLLLRLRNEFSTRVLRFFSSFKAFFFYCDRICINICLYLEYATVDSLQLFVYVHQLLLYVAVLDEQ